MEKKFALLGFIILGFWVALVIKWKDPWPGFNQLFLGDYQFEEPNHQSLNHQSCSGGDQDYRAWKQRKIEVFGIRRSTWAEDLVTFHLGSVLTCTTDFIGEIEGFSASTSTKFGALATFNTSVAKNDYPLCLEIRPLNYPLIQGRGSMRSSCFLLLQRVSRVLVEVSRFSFDLPVFPISFGIKMSWVYLRDGFSLEPYYQSGLAEKIQSNKCH
ncbi:hypothetical protein ABKV19_019295 [Rosa sericea]